MKYLAEIDGVIQIVETSNNVPMYEIGDEVVYNDNDVGVVEIIETLTMPDGSFFVNYTFEDGGQCPEDWIKGMLDQQTKEEMTNDITGSN